MTTSLTPAVLRAAAAASPETPAPTMATETLLAAAMEVLKNRLSRRRMQSNETDLWRYYRAARQLYSHASSPTLNFLVSAICGVRIERCTTL